MKIISIIPARGGSKGIPKKNIKHLAGKPLICYSIEQSLSSKLIQKTIVSTEDSEIKKISKKCGAEVIDRPKELAKDNTPTLPVVKHIIEIEKPDLVVLLQPTSPLRRNNDIDKAIKMIREDNYDSVFSACRTHKILWNNNSKPINYDLKIRKTRQERKPEYFENGSIYAFKVPLFLKYNNFYFGNIGLYEMPMELSFEIDSPFDFWLCEQILISQFNDCL